MTPDESNHIIPDAPDPNRQDPGDNRLQTMLDAIGRDDSLPKEFLRDAREGLDQVKNEKDLDAVIRKLNREMHHYLKPVASKRVRKTIGNLNWTYWAVVLIILLCVLAFIVIRMQLKSH